MKEVIQLLGSVVVAFPLLACGGDDGGGGGDGGAGGSGGGLDPNVPPVVDGNWVRPDAATTWQWQLSGTVNTSYDVDVYDIDLFKEDVALIEQLHADGRIVICYFSGGSFEDWRPDVADFNPAALGSDLDGWEGEQWLDVRDPSVHAVMRARLDLAVDKGCDGVEPDNMDGYDNDSGFDLTAEDQLAFNRFIANEAHERDLAVALKNDGPQADELLAYFDISVNEECHQFDECDDLLVFVDADKPIFNAEYPGDLAAAEAAEDDICAKAAAADTRTLILPLELDDSYRISCD